MTAWNAEIIEQGNGLPEAGSYVAADDGELYRIVEIEGRTNTGRQSGQGSWSRAVVLLDDWDDVDEDDIFPALAVLNAVRAVITDA